MACAGVKDLRAATKAPWSLPPEYCHPFPYPAWVPPPTQSSGASNPVATHPVSTSLIWRSLGIHFTTTQLDKAHPWNQCSLWAFTSMATSAPITCLVFD